MADTIHVTPAESVVLSALWRNGPLSFASLIEAVSDRQSWGEATVKTLLSRLMQKKAVLSIRVDGRQRYHARIDRRAYIDAEIKELADRLFDGDSRALAEHILQSTLA